MKYLRSFSFVLALMFLATTARAQVTSLSLNSDPGDFVGGGQTIFLTPADGTFTANQNFDNGVSVNFEGNQLGQFWFMDFAAANNAPLTVGTYTGAMRFPFQASSSPGFDVFGDGAGCNTLTGTFTVLQVSLGATGTVNSFDATF